MILCDNRNVNLAEATLKTTSGAFSLWCASDDKKHYITMADSVRCWKFESFEVAEQAFEAFIYINSKGYEDGRTQMKEKVKRNIVNLLVREY